MNSGQLVTSVSYSPPSPAMFILSFFICSIVSSLIGCVSHSFFIPSALVLLIHISHLFFINHFMYCSWFIPHSGAKNFSPSFSLIFSTRILW